MSINISASTPGVDVIHQIKVGNDNWNVAAKYIWDGSTATTSKAYSWSDITSLVTNAFTVEVFTTLPALPASPVDKYDHTMALIASQDGVDGSYDEYIIVNQNGTRSWELVGTTKTELAGLVTNNAGGQTVYTTSNGSQTATGSATVTYAKPNANTGEVAATSASGTAAVTYAKPNANTGYNTATTATGSATVTYAKPNANTGYNTESTINGSSFGFSGTAATISGSVDYTPQGSVTGSASVASHSHTVSGIADSSRTFVITSAIKSAVLATTTATSGVTVPVTLPTSAASNGSHTHTIGSQTVSVGSASGWSAGTNPALTVTNKTVVKGLKTDTTANDNIMTSPTVTSGVLSWTIKDLDTDSVGSASGWSAGTRPALTVTATTVVKSVDANTGSDGAHTHTLSGGSVGKMTVTTEAASTLSKAYLTGVNANTGYNTATTIQGSSFGFSGTTKTITVSTSYTPQGSITGSATVASHSHAIGTTNASASGTAGVSVASHSHAIGTSNTTASGSATVTVPAHSHTIGTTDASASGTAKVAVSNHSHQVTVASHTHHTVAS